MSDWTSWLPSSWLNAGGLGPSVQVMLAVSILGLLPSVFLLTTCWMRFVVVLGLLRQAIGGAQILPNQVITGLSLMLTIAIMAPVWEAAWQEGWSPTSPLSSRMKPNSGRPWGPPSRARWLRSGDS